MNFRPATRDSPVARSARLRQAVLSSARSTDRYHQAAQHHAHGHVQQPAHACLHTNAPHRCLLRTGLNRRGPCPAGSYQHSRTGRYLLPEPILRPQEVGPKRGFNQRAPTALPFSTRLSTNCLQQTIHLQQGTLPKAPAPTDNKPCGPKRPRVVASGTAWRRGRLHQPLRCMTRAKGARRAVTTYVLCLQALTAGSIWLTRLLRGQSGKMVIVVSF
jgi:hypothetical protein